MNKTKRFYFEGQPQNMVYIDVDYNVEQREKFNIVFEILVSSPSADILSKYSPNGYGTWRCTQEAKKVVGKDEHLWYDAQVNTNLKYAITRLVSSNEGELEESLIQGSLIFNEVCRKVIEFQEKFKQDYDKSVELKKWLESKEHENPE